MYTPTIHSILFSKTRWQVLNELVLRGNNGIHLREIARRTELNVNGIRRELQNLENAGIVVSRKIGSQNLFFVNPQCQILNELRMLVIKTGGVAGEIEAALRSIEKKIKLAYIYGSYASGTFGVDSDIDLMVVGSVAFRTVADILMDVEDKIQIEINPTVYSIKEYTDKLRKGKGFVYNVHAGERIMLVGDIDEPSETA